MILTRSPLRISIAGGGTDLPSYYEKYGSFFISAAIDKYVYVSAHIPFDPKFILKYSRYETCESIDQIGHPIIREALRYFKEDISFVEIASMADIPSGTGLGSSGSFTTALILALSELRNKQMLPHEIAALACEIEIQKLSESIGKQDQYIAAFGGITQFNINQSGEVSPEIMQLEPNFQSHLEDSLLLFYTGKSRSASKILMQEDIRLKSNDSGIVENLHEVQEMAFNIRDSLLESDLGKFGQLMDKHWKMKIKRNPSVTYPEINNAYNLAKNAGALGGKLVGAGGGGFLLFVAENPQKVRSAIEEAGFSEVKFRFDFEGTKKIT